MALDLIEHGLLSPLVTELRAGEALLLGVSTTDSRVIPWLRQDAFVLEAEVIEVREKLSAPTTGGLERKASPQFISPVSRSVP